MLLMTGSPPNDENDTYKGDGILITGFYDDIVFRAIIVDDGTVYPEFIQKFMILFTRKGETILWQKELFSI